MSDLEDMIEELKDKETYVIYKRSLPPRISKIIAQNLESYKDALAFCKTMKLQTHEKNDEQGNRYMVYYDILPDGLRLKDVYYNDPKITTKGNDKKAVGRSYMDLEG